jgi:hypothetical protein
MLTFKKIDKYKKIEIKSMRENSYPFKMLPGKCLITKWLDNRNRQEVNCIVVIF